MSNDTFRNDKTPGGQQYSSSSRFWAGNACILVATMFWGINVSFTKALIPHWMTSDSISAVRLIGGCIMFWTTSLFIKNSHIDHRDWRNLILGGFVGLFGFIYLFVMSLRYANPIDVSIIMTLPPMFVILMDILFRHYRPTTVEIAGVAISFIGAIIVITAGGSGKTGSDNLLGDALAVASTICYAFYLVILERPTQKYRPVTMLRWVFLFAAIPAIALTVGIDQLAILHTDATEPWLEISFILLCPTFIAYFLVQPAIRFIGSELVSIYQYLLPVFATASAVLMGLDKLKWVQIAAMVIIVGGVALTNIGKCHNRHKKSNEITD